MRVEVLAAGVAAVLGGATAMGQTQLHLMPVPARMTVDGGALALKSTFAAEVQGPKSARLTEAMARAVRRVEAATGLRHAGSGVNSGEIPGPKSGTRGTRLVVQVGHEAAAVQAFEEDESYRLKVTTAGVEIDAPNELGAMHGLETLTQLVRPGLVQAGSAGYEIPAVTIEDAPRFRWRGLLIDCGRHFEPVAVLKRNLDGMAAMKLNVFHWHLTEDQGFRIESKVFPKLIGVGADGQFYTQQDAKEIVAYARARGIRVVPEFEMPGHSTAWLTAYPELASGSSPKEVRTEFGISPYAMDPTREATYAFVGRFLTEMAGIFPDAYVHIGGDETPAPDWKTNPRILAFKKAHGIRDNDGLQAYFNTRVLKILARLHRHMMGWDEVLTPGLPKDVVVQSWRGEESLGKGAKLGYEGVLSAPYYLDGMKTAGTHYLADPLPSTSDLTAEERKRVLGGEVCMWGEQLDGRTIDSRIWPRTAAMAERFWSPESVRDVDDMYRRLEYASVELEGLGLTHLSAGDAALRELAGTERIDALRTVAGVMEPVSFGERFDGQRTDQLTQLDSFVDAVRPDPPSRHWFEAAVKRVVADPAGAAAERAELAAWLGRLAAAVPEARRLMEASPRLREVETRAGQLEELAAMGQEALGYLGRGEKAPPGWGAKQAAALEAMKKPSALVRFTLLPAMEQLVKSAE
jgi:hexosaminidase